MTKREQTQVERLFNGAKNRKAIKDARRIGEAVGVPRRQVMRYLQDQKLAKYSEGSYA